MSALASGVRPYQQETAIRAGSHRLEGIMNTSRFAQVIGAVAAAATTLTVFSAVVSLADHDKAALLAAKIAPTKLAARTTPAQR